MILKTGTKGNPKNDVGRITNMLAELQTKLYFIMCAFCALSLISLKRSPSQLSNDKQCLNRDIDGKMDAMIASSTQNFIICHYRYARKSCWNFKLTEKCMKQKTSPIGRGREILVKDFTLAIYHYFIFRWRRPTVGGCSPIFHEKTLVVQIHRDETERLQSGIKMAVTQWVCNHARYKVGSTKHFSHCILNEGRAIYIITERVREIEIESPKILTFKTFLRP